jgi:hypothetical protein
MTLQAIDWPTITRAQASRLIPAAARAEAAAAERFEASGTEADEAAMLAAFTVWEDLRVFVICGERPEA